MTTMVLVGAGASALRGVGAGALAESMYCCGDRYGRLGLPKNGKEKKLLLPEGYSERG